MKIGFIGAGNIGGTLAPLWHKANHDIFLSSRHPEQLDELAKSVNGTAGTPQEAAQVCEAFLLAVPLSAIPDLGLALGKDLETKVILDACNAIPKRDAALAETAAKHPAGSGGWAQDHFPNAFVVKAFNTVYFGTMQERAHQDPKVGVPLAGDSDHARSIAKALVSEAGFDPVDLGAMARCRDIDFGSPVWNSNMSGDELRAHFNL